MKLHFHYKVILYYYEIIHEQNQYNMNYIINVNKFILMAI